jgi:hypothetical protein
MTKPELIIQDTGGFHNGDLKATRTRLMRGGSWKRQRVVVVIPAAESIPAKVYLSHCALGFPPNNGVVRILALGQEVGEAYSNAIESILSHPELSQWEYVLTLEHDQLVPADGVIRLIERMEEHPELSCIGGLYYTKSHSGVAQIWGDVSDPIVNFRPQLPDLNGGLVECCGTGMGFNLWRLSMFKDPKLRRPWFQTQTKGGLATQDLFAWGDFRKHGYRCAIDCSVKVGHYDHEGKFGPAGMVW